MNKLAIIFLLFSFSLKAQDSVVVARNSIFFSLGGNGLRYSFGFNRNINIGRNKIYLSPEIDLAAYKNRDFGYFYFPLSLSMLYRLNHNLLIAGGINYVGGKSWFRSYLHTEYWYPGTEWYLLPSFGIRRLNNDGGIYFSFKALLVFNFVNNYGFKADLPFDKLNLEKKKFLPWPELSVGYTFPRHK